MARHQVTDNWRLGALLAAVTMLLWSSLPVALRVALEVLDPFTLTWVRFLAAGVVCALWIGATGRLRRYAGVSRTSWLLLSAAALALTPLGTLAVVALLSQWWPAHVRPETISAIGLGGAVLVVVGSMATSLGSSRRRRAPHAIAAAEEPDA